MPTTLEIRDIPKGLQIHVTEPHRIVPILLNFVVAVVALLLILHYVESRLFQVFASLIVTVSVGRQIIAHLRGTDVELTVTNLELTSTGHAPDGYKSSTISRADIYNFEFRKARGGGEDADQPRGLYAEHHGVLINPVTCILPHLDERQTEQAIEAICRRFPDTTTIPPVAPYLASLNLNQPK